MIELVLTRSAEACYRAFCDFSSTRHWLPDVDKVRVVRADDRGRPLEVYYELQERLSYALVYAYDEEHRAVRWVPSVGVRDAVSGHARFEPHPQGCRFIYAVDGLRVDEGREADVANAFARWVQR